MEKVTVLEEEDLVEIVGGSRVSGSFGGGPFKSKWKFKWWR